MRHKMRGRKLGRNHSHRRAMFRNMAASLIKTVAADEEDPEAPRVPGRIVTTVAKAKELRPYVEKLVTLAKKALPHTRAAAEYATTAEPRSDAYKTWRQSDEWQQWNQAIAPATALRRRAFSQLRDKEAVEILFDVLGERFEERPGGYTRVVRLAKVRLGDAGERAMIEFVGENDRTKTRRRVAPVVAPEESTESEETTDEAAAEETPSDEAPTDETPDAEATAEEPGDEDEEKTEA